MALHNLRFSLFRYEHVLHRNFHPINIESNVHLSLFKTFVRWCGRARARARAAMMGRQRMRNTKPVEKNVPVVRNVIPKVYRFFFLSFSPNAMKFALSASTLDAAK